MKTSTKGIFVGSFNENDIRSGKDRQAVENMKRQTNLQYTNSEIVQCKGETLLRIWVCSLENCKTM